MTSTQQDRTTRGTGTTTTQRGTTTTQRGTATTSGTSRSSGTASRGVTSTQQDRTTRGTGTATTQRGTTTTQRGTTTTSGTTRGTTGTVTRGTTGTTTRGTTTSRNTSTVATGGTVRSTSNVTRSGLSHSVSASNAPKAGQEHYRDEGGNYRYSDDIRLDNNHNIHRVPPRERDIMAWDRPGFFWGDHPHYYGYRIHSLPPHYRRIRHWGIDYYFYNGIYYRPFGGVYVVCRPPFGTPLEAAIDRAILRAVRFSYYCNTYRTYNTIFDNYNVIAQQNLIIAQNNARIAAQNASYALNASRSLTAYELANKLGLVQSYAYANSEYFYQDGVFYSVSASGAYTTIVPPAGALVSSLPDDYETIVLDGIEYYMVDNTVYRTTLFDGQPYLEVLGQMYGSMYNQYSLYR